MPTDIETGENCNCENKNNVDNSLEKNSCQNCPQDFLMPNVFHNNMPIYSKGNQNYSEINNLQNTPSSDMPNPPIYYPQFTMPPATTEVEKTKSFGVVSIIAFCLGLCGIIFFVLGALCLSAKLSGLNLFLTINTSPKIMSFVIGMFSTSFAIFFACLICGAISLKSKSSSSVLAMAISSLLIIPSLIMTIICAATKIFTELLL